jgi:hypothetical protein
MPKAEKQHLRLHTSERVAIMAALDFAAYHNGDRAQTEAIRKARDYLARQEQHEAPSGHVVLVRQ